MFQRSSFRQLTDLQSILSGLGAAGSGEGSPSVDLASGLSGELVQPLLQNPGFVRKMKELLPAEHQNNDVADEIKGEIFTGFNIDESV